MGNNQLMHSLKFVKKLHQKKYRDKTGLYLAEGKKIVEEALKLGLIEQIFITKENQREFFNASVIEEKTMKEISTMEISPGVLAVVRKQVGLKLSDDKTLIVEDLRDPGNMGTIIRSAEAFGFAIGLLGNCVDPWNEKCVQASMGSIFRVSISFYTYEDLERLKDIKKIYATYLEKSFNPKDVKFSKDGILLIGSESHGLSERALNLSTDFLKIPMEGQVESLNAAIAASILMYMWNQ